MKPKTAAHASVAPELTNEGAQFRFMLNGQVVPPDTWALAAGEAGRAAIDALRNMELLGRAALDEHEALLDHAGIAGLAPTAAAALGLPAATDAVLTLSMSPGWPPPHIDAVWTRANGLPLAAAERRGAILHVADRLQRLPDPLFAIAEAVDEYRNAPADDPDERLRRLVRLKAALPAQPEGAVSATGMILSMRVAYAETFSLDVTGDAADPHFAPVLHGRAPQPMPGQSDETAPSRLLPPVYQNAFTHKEFGSRADTRPAYALGDGWYVALSRPLQNALQVVREMQQATPGTRREFLRNPRPWLEARVGADYDATVLETLFSETQEFSDRVKGLGLWQPRVVPWVVMKPTDWFGPPEFGLDLNGVRIKLTAEDLTTLPTRIDAAIRAGAEVVRSSEPDGPFIPATAEVRQAVSDLSESVAPPPLPPGIEPPPAPAPAPDGKATVLILTNEQEAEYQRNFERRACQLPDSMPTCVATALKPHQLEGVAWLRDAWNVGRPGVLLADEMGLGKTLQCLVLLAQLREAMRAGRLANKPIMVVAPVGLLATWEDEHQQHLQAGGLGEMCKAYGQGLARLRVPPTTPGAPRQLDRTQIGRSDWVLTTYETMRDNARAFAEVPIAAVVFDEAQRIKNPGTQVTDAAKALNADFWIALTGTPVENRLADLWCIVDTIQPGFFPELKRFSARYEREPRREDLVDLKRQLEHGTEHTPAIMLRRLKVQRLPGLPAKREADLPARTMPPVQTAAYACSLEHGRTAADRGAKLRALHALRAISLHPDPKMEAGDAEFAAASARLLLCLGVLDAIRERGEKALLFLEDLAMQARLCGLLHRRYRFPRAPAVINGGVDAERRKAHVAAFQQALPGFDVMILSPRAAGVGLTLTAANNVIHLSRWWNPAVEDQCTDRVHRIGQIRDVNVYLPMATFPEAPARSFDHNLHDLLTRKRDLAADLLLPPTLSSSEEDALFRETFGSSS